MPEFLKTTMQSIQYDCQEKIKEYSKELQVLQKDILALEECSWEQII